jgi:hypothetical protein
VLLIADADELAASVAPASVVLIVPRGHEVLDTRRAPGDERESAVRGDVCCG